MLTSLLAQQEVNEKMPEATVLQFRNNIYVAGYEQGGQELHFRLKKFNTTLEKSGQESKSLGKHKAEDFHAPVFDTTHGFLSVTVQKKKNDKTATLLRYNENLKSIAFIENAEITRINSFAAFENEKIYYKNQLYMVRQAKDSAGRFYFYRYDLKDSSALFTYNFKWQFNFDQHTYHRIHPVFANATHIYVYVICLDGEKKGQWILVFNSENGNLTKAIKLNKNDNEICFVSKAEVLGEKEDIILAGVKYPSANVDLKNGNFSMNYLTSKTVNTLFCEIDSSGEVKTRLENFIAVPNDILKEKEIKDLVFKCNVLEKTESGFNLNYECLHKGKDGIFRTYGFLLSKLVITPENILKPENNAFLPCYRNEKKLPKSTTGNPLGKETANQYDNEKVIQADRLFYKNAFVKNFTEASMQINTLKKVAYILSFYENKKDSTLYLYKYSMKNYVWESASLKTSTDFSSYNVFSAGENKFIIFISSKNKTDFSLSYIEL